MLCQDIGHLQEVGGAAQAQAVKIKTWRPKGYGAATLPLVSEPHVLSGHLFYSLLLASLRTGVEMVAPLCVFLVHCP